MKRRPGFTTIVSRDVRGRRLPSAPPTEQQVRGSVLGILRDTRLCSIATVTPRHRACISTAHFCYSAELELFFLSHPASHHSRNLAVNPSMAIAVFDSRQPWGGADRGVQLAGRCHQAAGSEIARAERLYGTRFTAYSQWRATSAEDAAAREYRFYRFVPTRVKILDEPAFGSAVFVEATVTRESTREPTVETQVSVTRRTPLRAPRG